MENEVLSERGDMLEVKTREAVQRLADSEKTCQRLLLEEGCRDRLVQVLVTTLEPKGLLLVPLEP